MKVGMAIVLELPNLRQEHKKHPERRRGGGTQNDPPKVQGYGATLPPRRSGCQPEAWSGRTGESRTNAGTGTPCRPGAADPIGAGEAHGGRVRTAKGVADGSDLACEE